MAVERSNPLAWLSHREFGARQNVETRKIVIDRLSRLSLDGETRLQSKAAGGITCLSVDSAEQRYTLAAAQDGSIQCFDILGASTDAPEQPLFTVSPRTNGARSNGGHTASATAADWFPNDNGAFVSCSKDMTAKLWDPNSATLVASFSTIQPAHTLSMSPTQTLAAVGCDDCCIRLLDVSAGVATHTLMGYGAGVMSVAWCSVNEHQVVGGDASGEMRLFDIRRAGTLHSFDLSDASASSTTAQTSVVSPADTSRDNIAPGGHNILATAPAATRAHDGAITGLIQTPDAQWWVSAGTDNAVRLWSVSEHTNSLMRFPGALNSARCARQIAVDPSSQVLYFPSGSVVSTYSLATGEKLSDLRGHHATINAAAWSTRQASLITGSTDKQLLLWSPGAAPQDSTTAPPSCSVFLLHGQYVLVAADCVGLAPQGRVVDGIEHSESTGYACTGRNSGDVHAVCVGGDPVANAGDSDAWSDDDVIGSAAMRGPDWEGGAAGELRGAFSGGRRITSAARDVVIPPSEVAPREPDGNAAPGLEDEEAGGSGAPAVPQRLQAVSEAALAHRRGRTGAGRGRGGLQQGRSSGSVSKARKADGASQRIKRIAANLVQRLSSHMPQGSREAGATATNVYIPPQGAGRAAVARAAAADSSLPESSDVGAGRQ